MIKYNKLDNEHELNELYVMLCDIRAYNLVHVTCEWVDRYKYSAIHVHYNNKVLSVHADNKHDGIYINTLAHNAYKQHTARDIMSQLKTIMEW